MSLSPDTFDGFGQQKLPEYTYVPGLTPHPVSDVRGHAYGQPRPAAIGQLQAGTELFNHGYYWEAHEAWEAEWMAAGRAGCRADLIKGLIKLAACGVKCLEGNRDGAMRHARRAGELILRSIAEHSDLISDPKCEALLALAQRSAIHPPLATAEQQQQAQHGGVPVLGDLPEIFQHE